MTGIDYGRHTPTINRNPKSGIRYGIASTHKLADWVQDESEAQYHRGCPSCADDLPDAFESPGNCPTCSEHIEDGEDWADSPYAWTVLCDGVDGSIDESGDLWVFKSPVTTTGVHCSPCAPGAVTIGPDPVPDGPVAYGLPDGWWKAREDR